MDRVFKELERIQKEYAWSDARLARELGTTPASFSRYKSGKRPPSLELIRGIARLARTMPRLHLALYDYLVS